MISVEKPKKARAEEALTPELIATPVSTALLLGKICEAGHGCFGPVESYDLVDPCIQEFIQGGCTSAAMNQSVYEQYAKDPESVRQGTHKEFAVVKGRIVAPHFDDDDEISTGIVLSNPEIFVPGCGDFVPIADMHDTKYMLLRWSKMAQLGTVNQSTHCCVRELVAVGMECTVYIDFETLVEDERLMIKRWGFVEQPSVPYMAGARRKSVPIYYLPKAFIIAEVGSDSFYEETFWVESIYRDWWDVVVKSFHESGCKLNENFDVDLRFPDDFGEHKYSRGFLNEDRTAEETDED